MFISLAKMHLRILFDYHMAVGCLAINILFVCLKFMTLCGIGAIEMVP